MFMKSVRKTFGHGGNRLYANGVEFKSLLNIEIHFVLCSPDHFNGVSGPFPRGQFRAAGQNAGQTSVLFFYLSVFGSLITVFAFVFYFYNESNRFETSLQAANRKLVALSETDPLTQLPNRRSFRKNLNREWGRGVRDKTSLGVMMIDVDHFKMFNDYYGH